jgi:hypothetical protein
LNLLRVALVASGVGRGWAVEAGQPLASCQAFVVHQPSLDAFVAVVAFLAVILTYFQNFKVKVSIQNLRKIIHRKLFHNHRELCQKFSSVQRLID